MTFLAWRAKAEAYVSMCSLAGEMSRHRFDPLLLADLRSSMHDQRAALSFSLGSTPDEVDRNGYQFPVEVEQLGLFGTTPVVHLPEEKR